MRHYFITGSSSGIGRALCEELFQFSDVRVHGFARRNTLENPSYLHHHLDLSDLTSVKSFDFPKVGKEDSVFLVNNAGTLGDVAKAGEQDAEGIISGFNVNLVSVALITNTFIKTYSNCKGQKVIVNISSGAGKSPIDGWSVYCATKAGLDLFSRVVSEEQKISGQGFNIFSVAPGIVDTEMQAMIRTAKEKDFSRVDHFRRYKEQGELSDPQLVSQKILSILDNPEKFNETVFSVRDF